MNASGWLSMTLVAAAVAACSDGGASVGSSGTAGSAGTATAASGGGAGTSGAPVGAGGSDAAGTGPVAAGSGGVAGAAGASGMTGSAGAGGGTDGCGQSFIAFGTDFAPFATWTSFFIADGAATFDEAAGARTIYFNQVPPSGSKHFPVGTIIVKVIPDGAPPNPQIFAMVKRGGCFNALGADGWEWFELDGASGGASIVWRGVAPPSGSGYGGGLGGGMCNNCHAVASGNDYVQDSSLQLSVP